MTTTSWLSWTTSLSGLKPILFPTKSTDCCRDSISTLDLKVRSSSTIALRSREKLRFCSLQETLWDTRHRQKANSFTSSV
ncbi:hypothetical protein TNCV_2475121 [Trichonephila clavipes]|nr:hypothetical protein TNCV_2475121 [Trichonephila clavipes]